MSAGIVISAKPIDGAYFELIVESGEAAARARLAETLRAATGTASWVTARHWTTSTRTGVQVLVGLAERVTSLRLVNVAPSILKVLKLTGTDQMLFGH